MKYRNVPESLPSQPPLPSWDHGFRLVWAAIIFGLLTFLLCTTVLKG